MSDDNILSEMAAEKNRLVRELMISIIGHEPSANEKKEFTIVHNLYESKIYHKGRYVGTVQYQAFDHSAI
jgi:hypothetical protein